MPHPRPWHCQDPDLLGPTTVVPLPVDPKPGLGIPLLLLSTTSVAWSGHWTLPATHPHFTLTPGVDCDPIPEIASTQVHVYSPTVEPSTQPPPGWHPEPRPTVFDVSSSDECMLTPEGASPPTPGSRRSAIDNHSSYASPILEEQKKNMKRTPQPTLTQSKLTSMFNPQGKQHEVPGPPDARRTLTLDEVEMDTTQTPVPAPPAPPTAAASSGSAFLTVDLFLKAMKENRDDIISSFNASIGNLSRRIEDNSALIATNAGAIRQQTEREADRRNEIEKLTERVQRLEKRGDGPPGDRAIEKRAVLSQDYMLARRSVRLWPVSGCDEEALWEGVGEFLHDTLAIRSDDLCQDDIEAITRIRGEDAAREEALVTFFDKKKRDLVLTHSPSLATKIDGDNRPTAGVRLEIPPELDDTFRLLNRFGARLRARHGPGTRRHIKFDDFNASLFTNVKLPGDANWTRVTADMARSDLEASIREEGLATQKRLASKLVPGPRERLNRPMTTRTEALLGPPPSEAPVAGPSGKRPRWSVPERRQRL